MKVVLALLLTALTFQAAAGKKSKLRSLVEDSEQLNDTTHRHLAGSLRTVGNNGNPTYVFPLGECEGDCDPNANECAGNLQCYTGTANTVPGCEGMRKSNKRGKMLNYCYAASTRTTPTPKPVAQTPLDPVESTPECDNLAIQSAITSPPLTLVIRIFEIQSTELTSPFVGQTVINVPGIVTAFNGNIFFLQDQVGDGDDYTSDGIEVYCIDCMGTPLRPEGTLGNTEVVLETGDVVSIKQGLVVETIPDPVLFPRSQPTTQIRASKEDIIILSRGIARPDPVIIGAEGRLPPSHGMVEGIKFWETLEGMLVKVKTPLVVAPSNGEDVFVVTDDGVFASGLSPRGTLVINPDDYNPEKIKINEDPTIYDFFFPEAFVGDKFDNVLGVMSYDDGNYEIIPIEHYGIESFSDLQLTRTSCVTATYTMLVGTYNFGGTTSSSSTFSWLASDITFNLGYPDVLAVQGIENAAAALALVNQLPPTQSYKFVTYEAMDLAIFYNEWRVELVTSGTSAAFGLWATFKYYPTQKMFTVINVDLTSKAFSAAITGVFQPWLDIQESNDVNAGLASRLAATNAIRSFLTTRRSTSHIVMGTFNDFEWISPLINMERYAMKNLIDGIPHDERYSEIYQGNARAVDHILVSKDFCPGAEGEYIRLNTEFPISKAPSDHDPMVGCIDLF